MFILLHIILVLDVRGVPICPWGRYGDTCDQNCSKHCSISPSLGIIHCDRTSGHCSEGCIPGWYDDTCNKECNTKCMNNICNHGDGACTRGCKGGERGNFCEISGEEHETKGNDSTPLGNIIVPVIVIIALLVLLMFPIGRWAKRRSGNSVERSDYMAVNNEETWHVSHDVRGSLKWLTSDTPLHKASAEGNLDLVKEIMNDGLFNINTRGPYGLTPLMLAALSGHYNVFEYLNQEGGDMTLKDHDGDHILSIACVGGNMDILKYVVLHEPTLINRKRIDGRTALMWAAWHGRKTVFEYLLDRKATLLLDDNDGDNILHYACYGGHIDIVKYVIDKTPLNINTRNLLGRTALMIAATYGHKEVFDLLVWKGCDISHKDEEGNNILHAACRGGHVKMVEHVLSQKNIDINCRGQCGGTPLMFATFYGHRDVYDLLCGKGADATLVDNMGNNILHVACIEGHVEMVKRILSQGLADINSEKGSMEIVSLDINARNRQGETASMVAKRKHHMELYNFLVSKEG